MTSWRVLIAAGALQGSEPELGTDAAAGFVEALVATDPEGDPPVTTFGPHEWSVRLTVEAASAAEALPIAADRCSQAIRKVGIPRWPIIRIGVIRAAEIEAGTARAGPPPSTETADSPGSAPLVGISEIAAILGLSRQRASEVSRLGSFPAPVARLASGPVWTKPAVLRFAATWERKRGRPRRSSTPPPPPNR